MKVAASLVLLIVILAHMAQAQLKGRRQPAIPSFKNMSAGLELPNNATSIRENIVDTFSCDERIYGYYADMDNECQIFHVCLPRSRNVLRFSFICPAETVFNQATFVCTRTESSIPCAESEKYYELNEQLGEMGITEELPPATEAEAEGNEVDSTTDAWSMNPRPIKPPAKKPTRRTTSKPGQKRRWY